MKKLYSFKSFNSNPSVLGADRLWNNIIAGRLIDKISDIVSI